MQIHVWTEARFLRTPDGLTWTPSSNDYEFWMRYLDVFDETRVVAHVLDVGRPDEDWRRVDGPRVSVVPLPHYRGIAQLSVRYRKLAHASRAALAGDGAAHLFRVPSVVANPAIHRLRQERRPFFLEVVGDPREAFSPLASDSPLRRFIRVYAGQAMARQIASADGVAYVTESTLQNRYPPRPDAVTENFSDVVLGPADFVHGARDYPAGLGDPIKICTVASLEQPYKGVDVLIEAVAMLIHDGVRVELTVVGDGRTRPDLQSQASRLGVGGSTTFLGRIADRSEIRRVLDRSDIFVLPSRTEGLPRSLIEAMARGLVCIGTRVGGTPELLAPSQLVPPDDPPSIYSAVRSAAVRRTACQGRVPKEPRRSTQVRRVGAVAASGGLLPRNRSQITDPLKMRVLHLIKTSEGASWATEQIRHLTRQGIDVHVAIPEGLRANELRADGIPVHVVQTDASTRNPRELARRIRATQRLVTRLRPDVVHSHFVGTTITMRLALRDDRITRRVFQVPGPLHLEHATTTQAEFALRQPTDSWIATCKWTRERYLALGVKSSHVFLSYYGRDISEYESTVAGTLQSELNLPPNQTIVGMVAFIYAPKRYLGQRTGLKGHEDLIEAVGVLDDEGRDIQVVFVGGPWHGARSTRRRSMSLEPDASDLEAPF